MLELIPITIAPPDSLLASGGMPLTPPAWIFTGRTERALFEFLQALDMPAPVKKDVFATNRWVLREGEIRIQPSAETILSLETETRKRLYDELDGNPANETHHHPWSLSADLFEAALTSTRLSKAAQDIVRAVSYRRGDRIFIADLPAILSALDDPVERMRAVRLLRSASTYLVHLRISPDADLDTLLAYWGERGRRKDLRPIVEALAQRPDGGLLDIAHVMPAFARQRIYIYPDPALAQDGVRRDCHWTSLNFFNSQPDNRFGDSEFAQEYILARYYVTEDAPRFGDIIFFTLPDGRTIHSAVYLAADLAFTKNGDMLSQPWIIMDLLELRELYQTYYHSEVILQCWRAREESGRP